MSRWRTSLGLAAAMLSASGLASAGTLTTTVPVNIDLVDSCSDFHATGPFAFGDVPLSRIADKYVATSSLSITCSDGAPWQVTVQATTDNHDPYYCSGITLTGQLVYDDGTPAIFYMLYEDPDRTNELGSTPSCGAFAPLTGTGTGATALVPLYAITRAYSNTATTGMLSGSVTLILSF